MVVIQIVTYSLTYKKLDVRCPQRIKFVCFKRLAVKKIVLPLPHIVKWREWNTGHVTSSFGQVTNEGQG